MERFAYKVVFFSSWSCRYVVGVVFGFEHALLLLALWLQWVINPIPKWVRTAIARREYLAKELTKPKKE